MEPRACARRRASTIKSQSRSRTRCISAHANSRDFSAGFESTQAWSYASAFAGEGADLMTGLGVGLGREPGELDPEAIGSEAAERALALVGARAPETRRCPVVLDTFVAASFVGFIGGMLSAEAVQRGRSLFAGKEPACYHAVNLVIELVDSVLVALLLWALTRNRLATVLAIALIVTYFAFNPLVRRGASGGTVRAVTLLTMAAWLMVAMAGRWIGFS